MVSLIQILSWFKDGLFVNEEQFKKTWSSFWHKSERLPLSQVLGLNDSLDQTFQRINQLDQNKASKEDLLSVMDGLNPMGDALNMADLNTKLKRHKDSYFVLDQVDEDGNPYIFKYDEGIADWINTKQVIYKDVAKKSEVAKKSDLINEIQERVVYAKHSNILNATVYAKNKLTFNEVALTTSHGVLQNDGSITHTETTSWVVSDPVPTTKGDFIEFIGRTPFPPACAIYLYTENGGEVLQIGTDGNLYNKRIEIPESGYIRVCGRSLGEDKLTLKISKAEIFDSLQAYIKSEVSKVSIEGLLTLESATGFYDKDGVFNNSVNWRNTVFEVNKGAKYSIGVVTHGDVAIGIAYYDVDKAFHVVSQASFNGIIEITEEMKKLVVCSLAREGDEFYCRRVDQVGQDAISLANSSFSIKRGTIAGRPNQPFAGNNEGYFISYPTQEGTPPRIYRVVNGVPVNDGVCIKEEWFVSDYVRDAINYLALNLLGYATGKKAGFYFGVNIGGNKKHVSLTVGGRFTGSSLLVESAYIRFNVDTWDEEGNKLTELDTVDMFGKCYNFKRKINLADMYQRYLDSVAKDEEGNPINPIPPHVFINNIEASAGDIIFYNGKHKAYDGTQWNDMY